MHRARPFPLALDKKGTVTAFMAPSARSLYFIVGSLNAWLISTTFTHWFSPTPAPDLDFFFFFPSLTKCINSFGFPKNALGALTALLLTASQGRFPRPCSELCFFSPSGTPKCGGSWNSQLMIDLGDGMIPVACSVCREEGGGVHVQCGKSSLTPG